ncbi:hypothetical protein BGX33_000255 [Mortierella sp. NVP41]|nr:hypothetical protein BGX33_000255 [Mortierella sp. NVP41]
MILSFLDEDTVCRVTPLVSHQWLRISRYLRPVRIVVNYHTSWSSDLLDMKLLALKDSAIYLRLYIARANFGQSYDGTRLYAIMEDLQTRIRDQEYAFYADERNADTVNLYKTARSGNPFGTLRVLHLHLGPQALTAIDTFPFPTSLTKLSIVVCRDDRLVSLSWIAYKSPFLEELYIEGHPSRSRLTHLTWTSNDNHCLYRLRVLTFKGIRIFQIDLEAFFSICPDLTDVKLIEICTRENEISQDGLFDSLKTLRMATRSDLLLPLSGAMPPRELGRWLVHSQYKWLDLWFYLPNMTLPLLRSAISSPSLITSLEIIPPSSSRLGNVRSYSDQQDIYRRLHIYLCISPSLVHLQNLRTAIILEDIDLHRRRGFVDATVGLDKAWYPKPAGPTSHLGIWLCRRLRSLRVELHDTREVKYESPIHSRILFGYISRVCPYLEILDIDVPYAESGRRSQAPFYPELCMKLEGGMCLLAKLDRLRRLRISSDSGDWKVGCEDYEMSWISCSTYHRMNRMFRHWTLSLWKQKRMDEAKQEKARLESDAKAAEESQAAAEEQAMMEAEADAEAQAAAEAYAAIEAHAAAVEQAADDAQAAMEAQAAAVAVDTDEMDLDTEPDDSQDDIDTNQDDIVLGDIAGYGQDEVVWGDNGQDGTGLDAFDVDGFGQDDFGLGLVDLDDFEMEEPDDGLPGQDSSDDAVVGQAEFDQAVTGEMDSDEDEDEMELAAPSAACRFGAQQVRNDLQNLGLLNDVEAMIRWMQYDTFRPLPELKRLSLGFETLQRPRDEIRRVFPKCIDE